MKKNKKYDSRGMKETCLNCGKKGCSLAGVGNKARVNENNGCWVPKKDEAIIISREKDLELWKSVRNLSWFNDKKIFDEINKHTFDVEINEDIIKVKGVAKE